MELLHRIMGCLLVCADDTTDVPRTAAAAASAHGRFTLRQLCRLDAVGSCLDLLRSSRHGHSPQQDLTGEGPTVLSHPLSFDQRRRPKTFRTAIATAFFWPTSTTSFLPR
jgi:hypothetical protein